MPAPRPRECPVTMAAVSGAGITSDGVVPRTRSGEAGSRRRLGDAATLRHHPRAQFPHLFLQALELFESRGGGPGLTAPPREARRRTLHPLPGVPRGIRELRRDAPDRLGDLRVDAAPLLDEPLGDAGCFFPNRGEQSERQPPGLLHHAGLRRRMFVRALDMCRIAHDSLHLRPVYAIGTTGAPWPFRAARPFPRRL